MTSTTPMMGCGHAANATKDDQPICVICWPSNGSETVVADLDLSNRQAACHSCKKLAPSSTDLPFFGHQPGKASDGYYCGCRGWD